MDVILDSNAYLSDLRMESISFKNLLDYLRRTKCALILPRVVREEIVARYRYMLDVQAKKTAQAIAQFNRLMISKNGEIQFTPPRSIHTVRHLRRKLSGLQNAGLMRYYSDLTGVDINDIFLRGVNRRRPANKEGEQLRDVIIWLVALQYAESAKKQIALVTNDGDFWNDTEIHEHLKQDMGERKVNILLFRSIDDFIKSSAPEPKSVGESYAVKVLDIATLADEIAALTKKTLSGWKGFQPFIVRTTKLTSTKFSSGTVYQIDADTKFAELTYEVSALADLAFTGQPFATSFGASLFQALYTLPPAQAPQFAASAAKVFPATFRMSRPGIGLKGGRSSFDAPEPQRMTTATYAVSAKAHVFGRLLKDAPNEVELNRVEITKVEKAGEADEIPCRE